ncbi:MAG: hypothetical protein M1820_001647 [Bogoriella megaspora]|nr:MAG: hypothetical protein M1820_001647 [Bogoriella megaspora]
MATFFHNPPIPGLDPNADHSYQLKASGLSMLILSFLALVARFASRWLINARFLLDDYLILAAVPFAWAEAIVDINGAYHYNFGKHIAKATPAILVSFLQATWAFQLLYIFAIAFSKLSILAMYWRVFHVPSFKFPLILTGSLTLAWFVGCAVASILSCIPISGFWSLPPHGKCINNIAYYIGQAVGNILIDIILFSLPIFMISRLRISTSQKVAVCGIFLLGAFVTLASALRLWQLILTQRREGGFDPTWTLVGAAVWSVIETNLSIVCACLPALRPLLRLVLDGSLQTSRNGGYGTGRSRSFRGTGGGSWNGTKRSSLIGGWSRSSKRSPSAADVPLVGRPQAASVKGYVEENAVELGHRGGEGQVGIQRPVRPVRAMTSPGPGRTPSSKHWFDAGSERISESSDEPEPDKIGEAMGMGPTGPLNARRERPPPPALLQRSRSDQDRGQRQFSPAGPWRLEIEKTTSVQVEEQRTFGLNRDGRR